MQCRVSLDMNEWIKKGTFFFSIKCLLCNQAAHLALRLGVLNAEVAQVAAISKRPLVTVVVGDHRFAAAQVAELDPDDPIRLGVLHALPLVALLVDAGMLVRSPTCGLASASAGTLVRSSS